MATFNPGDVVRLASGGSKMTVDSIKKDNGWVCCHWLNEAKERRMEAFPPATLVAA